MADGLGGKGYVLFSGQLHDVEAAVEHAVASLTSQEQLIARVVIPQLHPEMWETSTRIQSSFLGYVRTAGELRSSRQECNWVALSVPLSLRPRLRARWGQLSDRSAARQGLQEVGEPVVAADGVAMAGPDELVYFVAAERLRWPVPRPLSRSIMPSSGIVDAGARRSVSRREDRAGLWIGSCDRSTCPSTKSALIAVRSARRRA